MRLAVRFLDNVIDVNRYPLDEIAEMTRGNRKIGLGVMGFADMLIQLGVPYDSEEGIAIAEQVMSFISDEAQKVSCELAAERGVFPNFKGSVYDRPDGMEIRNATVTTIAPTGTLSIIASCSSGVEPLFAISYVKRVMDGTELVEVNPYFEKIAREREFYTDDLMRKIAEKGSVRDIPEVPEDVRRVFCTALDIAPVWHVRMQAAFQRFTDNAVSKTVNFPEDATADDVRTGLRACVSRGLQGLHDLSLRQPRHAGPQRFGQGQESRGGQGRARTEAKAGADPRRHRAHKHRLRQHVRHHQRGRKRPLRGLRRNGQGGRLRAEPVGGNRPADLAVAARRDRSGIDTEASTRHPMPLARVGQRRDRAELRGRDRHSDRSLS